MSDSLKTGKALAKEAPLKFHDITKDEIPEVAKLVEDAYFAGDTHFINYEKKSEENLAAKSKQSLLTKSKTSTKTKFLDVETESDEEDFAPFENEKKTKTIPEKRGN